jgi:hypothetical protein
MMTTSSVGSCDRVPTSGDAGGVRVASRAMRVFGLVAVFAVALGCSRSRSAPPGEPQKTEVVSSAPAPDAELSDASGTMVTLSTVLGRHAETIVVFYRGFW